VWDVVGAREHQRRIPQALTGPAFEPSQGAPCSSQHPVEAASESLNLRFASLTKKGSNHDHHYIGLEELLEIIPANVVSLTGHAAGDVGCACGHR
jgi:hypothetical protein